MRVVILHMRYWPDATGTGPLVTELAEDLVALGDDVTVVTSAPHYGRSEIPAEYRRRIFHRSVRSGVKLWRTFAPVGHVANPFMRALDYGVYSVLSGLAAFGLGSQDVILCVAPPITVGFSGWLASRLTSAPIVFNAQDIWPDGLIAMGRARGRFIIWSLKLVERFVYRISRRITVVSKGMKANLTAKGVSADRITVIPNWADTSSIQPLPKSNSLAAAIGLGDRIVVLFAGNLGFAASLQSVIAAAELLRADTRICFLIVGEGGARAGLERRVRESGLSNVVFHTTQPAGRLSQVMASGDISLVTLNKDMGSVSVPSKSYAIMASARPILAAVPADSEVRDLVEQARCGLVVPPEAPEALAEAIRSLAEDPALRETYGANGRRYVESHFSRQALTSRYHKLLLDVASPESHGAA